MKRKYRIFPDITIDMRIELKSEAILKLLLTNEKQQLIQTLSEPLKKKKCPLSMINLKSVLNFHSHIIISTKLHE